MPVSAGLSGNRKETATGADGGGERSKHHFPSTLHPGLQALGQPISSPPPRGSKCGNAHPAAAPGDPPGSAKRLWGLVAASGRMHVPAASSALCTRNCLVSPPLPQTPACPLGPSPFRTGAQKPVRKAPTPPHPTHPPLPRAWVAVGVLHALGSRKARTGDTQRPPAWAPPEEGGLPGAFL